MRDASPDAWGRRVIEYRFGRATGELHEIDYLLHGPQDSAGYLSFGLKLEPPTRTRPYNRTHQLPALISASQAIEEGRHVAAHILEQLDPGTSMGGARPKATIEDAQCIWLGKFPGMDDRCNLQPVGDSDVLMVQRFGLVSGLTVPDCEDSYLDRELWSYPLLADNLRRCD